MSSSSSSTSPFSFLRLSISFWIGSFSSLEVGSNSSIFSASSLIPLADVELLSLISVFDFVDSVFDLLLI